MFHVVFCICVYLFFFSTIHLKKKVSDGLIYLCLTDVNTSDSERVRMPYLFLNEIQTEFTKTYGERAKVCEHIYVESQILYPLLVFNG
jgi:hypothetical protein